MGGTSCGQCRRTSCGESATTGAGAVVGTDAEAAAEDAPEPGALARVAARRRLEGSRDAERLRAARIPGSGGAWSVVTTGACGERTEAPARAGAPGDEEHLRGAKKEGRPGRGPPSVGGPIGPSGPSPGSAWDPRVWGLSRPMAGTRHTGGVGCPQRGPIPSHGIPDGEFYSPGEPPGVKTLKSRPQGLFPPPPHVFIVYHLSPESSSCDLSLSVARQRNLGRDS